MTEPPVRLCCMQRHYGPQCPDGTVMCCLCFGKFTIDQLATDENKPTDVCKECAEKEGWPEESWFAGLNN